MRKWNRLSLFAALVLLLSPVAAVQANMPPPSPFVLGVTVAKDDDGLRITKVEPGSHAARAELQPGDVIVGINGHWVKGMSADEQQNAIVSSHMWQLELIVVRGRRDIIAIRVRA